LFTRFLSRGAGRCFSAGRLRGRGRRSRPKPPSVKLRLEALEDRALLSPTLLDPNLGVRTVVSGLTQPTTMTFLGNNDFYVFEKTTGKVDHVINGVVAPTRLDFGAGPINNLPA